MTHVSVSGDRILDTEPLADLKAWLETLRTRQARVCTYLQRTVARAWCMAMTTTSPCERDFSHLLLAFQKRNASPMLKEIQLRIHAMMQSEPGLKDEVIRRARDIWAQGFLPERQSGEMRTGNFISGIKLQRKRQAPCCYCHPSCQ